ncbi:hypothetical protein [Neobacillus jeddahensis]|uniref:hypothetical protein n=1 Tax=Neobacillus jeddahensis TaxID=1461580 RepID=UPI000694098B|nr:hypothetical protein [Neobacillus jeddahensis]
MGLFINKLVHPEMYKNTEKLNEPNQSLVRKNELSAFMTEQQEINKLLNQMLKHELGDKIIQLSEHYETMASQLGKQEETTHLLSTIMNEQLELQREVAVKMAKQKEIHGGILKRLDKQDALLDKLSRQLNHIRSIIFERTNYLATKIDDGYKLTSSYVYKLMTGSDHPLTFFLLNQKKEENQPPQE